MSHRRVRRTVVALCTAGLVVACSAGGPGAVASQDAARLASVTAGSDVVLGTADATAVNVVGLDLVTLAAPLRTWWATFTDPTISESAWLDRAPQLLADMRVTVAHIEQQLGPGRDRVVRDAFAPYLQQWRAILAALEAMRTGVESGDRAAQQRATDVYNDAIGAIGRLDRQRVARVVAVYGREEAKRALAAQGLDPDRFGL